MWDCIRSHNAPFKRYPKGEELFYYFTNFSVAQLFPILFGYWGGLSDEEINKIVQSKNSYSKRSYRKMEDIASHLLADKDGDKLIQAFELLQEVESHKDIIKKLMEMYPNCEDIAFCYSEVCNK